MAPLLKGAGGGSVGGSDGSGPSGLSGTRGSGGASRAPVAGAPRMRLALAVSSSTLDNFGPPPDVPCPIDKPLPKSLAALARLGRGPRVASAGKRKGFPRSGRSGGKLGDQLLGEVEVGADVLDVVQVLQALDEAHHLGGLLVVQGDHRLGDEGPLGGVHFQSGALHLPAHVF